MSNKQRRDGDRRPSDRRDRDDRNDRRDSQPDDEQQRRPGDAEAQESDSLNSLKAILGKVATLLNSLKLTQEECTSLVEQLYGSVLEMDLKLAGETDDKRKSSVAAHIQNTTVTRRDGKLVVEFPKEKTSKPTPAKTAKTAEAMPKTSEAPTSSEAQPKAEAPAPKPAAETSAETPTEVAATPDTPTTPAPEEPQEKTGSEGSQD